MLLLRVAAFATADVTSLQPYDMQQLSTKDSTVALPPRAGCLWCRDYFRWLLQIPRPKQYALWGIVHDIKDFDRF